MNDLALRKEIMKRLATLWYDTDEPGIDDSGIKPWSAVADEVIRLMEWARLSGELIARGVTWEPGQAPGDAPLTLPPDDWKP